jgi:ParB/RepB/Spo0J family partition protein
VKKSEETFATVPVGKIVSESNRKHGGIGNIEILAESIKAEGHINPPTVIANEDGTYRVIAGRRRVEAVRQLKWKEVQVRVIDEADADRLESIGLAENVNRQEMHPLDEAEIFRKLLDKGTDIKDIAAYYDRTVAGIQHRARLMELSDELKEMFREGKIKLTGAALLASLPPEDQAKFAKKYEKKDSIGNWDISDFINQAQRCVIAWIADKQCEKCKNRTHNAEPGLFEEFGGLKDVCFDQDCYAGKWKKLIERLIAQADDIVRTENNIILGSNIPNFLPMKTKTLAVGEAEYELLAHKKFSWKETSKKAKKNTAWLVTAPYGSTEAAVKRVEYEAVEQVKQSAYGYHSAAYDPVKDFLIDQVSDIAVEDQQAAAESVRAKYRNSWRLNEEVASTLLSAIVSRRLKMENRENMVAAYLEDKYSNYDDTTGERIEFDDDFNREVFTVIFGPDGITRISDIPEEPLSKKLFLFLTATGFRTSDLPKLNASDEQWEEDEKSLFWKFAQMTREEYIIMYREFLSAAVRDALPEPAREEAAPEETGEEPPEGDE